MNAKKIKSCLPLSVRRLVLLLVIGVSVSMLGKGNRPSGTDPAAAPTDVTTEDVSQPLEEENADAHGGGPRCFRAGKHPPRRNRLIPSWM